MKKETLKLGLVVGSTLAALSQAPVIAAGEQTSMSNGEVAVVQPAVKSSFGGVKSGSGGTVRRGLDMDHDCKVLKKGVHNTSSCGDDGGSSGGGDDTAS